MKPICLVCSIVAAVLLAGSASAASPGTDPGQALREQDAAARRDRAKLRVETESNRKRLESCVTGSPGCAANDVPKLLLSLTRPEVEAILGPPQYRLHVAKDELYYWTVPLKTSGAAGSIRLSIIFGDCDYREKNSRRKAVCEAALH